MKRLTLMLFVAVAAVRCGPPGGDGADAGVSADYDCTDAPKVTTAQLQTELLETRCKTCHNVDNDPAIPGNMSTAAKAQELVGKVASYATTAGSTLKVVDPNNPQNSSLYLKVLGGGTKYKGPKNEAVGAQMPQGQTPLSAADMTKIKNWICTGATAQ